MLGTVYRRERVEDEGESSSGILQLDHPEKAVDLFAKATDRFRRRSLETMGKPSKEWFKVFLPVLIAVEHVVGEGIEQAVGERRGRERQFQPEHTLDAVEHPLVPQRLMHVFHGKRWVERTCSLHELLCGSLTLLEKEFTACIG